MSTTEIVLTIQRARAAGRRCADVETVLVVRLQPVLRRVAQRFSESARGSLAVEDLVQVGAIEALRFIERYDHQLGGDFEQHVYRRAMRACVDQVRLHAHDVHASAGAQAPARRARLKRTGETPVVVAADATAERAVSYDEGPEAALIAHERETLLRRCLNRLPLPYRDIVAWNRGIGRPTKSLRTLAFERGEPLSKTFGLFKEGEARLRALLEREGV